jgi:16S rRNA processing protein RimM
MKTEDHFRIGTILKTKGLKGEVQMYVDFDGLEAIKYSGVFIEIAGKLVPYFIASIKYPQPGVATIYLEDVDTIEKASILTKKDVYLPNKLKPKKKKDEFTLKDVKGFIAIDETHGEIGEITDILEYPQQVIASVRYNNREVLFPLNEAIITGINAEDGELYIDLPEGLLDIYME